MGLFDAFKKSDSSAIRGNEDMQSKIAFEDLISDVQKTELKTPEYYFKNSNLAKTIIAKPVLDATRNWIIINENNASEIEQEIEDFYLKQKLEDALVISRLNGSVLIVAKTLGDLLDYKEELIFNDILEVEDFFIITNYTKNYDQSNNVSSYNVSYNNTRLEVHPSRALEVINEKYIQYLDGLDSKYYGVLTRRSVRNALEIWEEKEQIYMYMLRTDGLGVYKVDGLNEAVKSGFLKDIVRRINIFSQNKIRSKTPTIDIKDDYEIKNIQMDYIDDFKSNMMTKISSETGIPSIILFGEQPKGMSNTGNASTSDYDKLLEGIQRGGMQDIINFYFKMKYPSKRIHYSIKSVENRSDLEKTEIQLKIAQTTAILIENEIMSPLEARNLFTGDDVNLVISLDNNK